MQVSAGNLGDLVGFSFGASQFASVTVASFAQADDGSVVDVLTEVLGNPASLSAGGNSSSYMVTGIADGADQVAVNQYQAGSGGDAFVQTLTYNVLGFNASSLLVSSLSLAELISALQNEQSVSGLIGVISAGQFPNGANVGFSPNGTFTAAPACFALGTRILTAAGEVAVEDIRVGDRVPGQMSGALRCVRWVGRLTVQTLRHPCPWDVAPVRVCAGALAPGQPRRDLLLSPDHAVLLRGVLIPVRYLINGATIRQERVEVITYLHVELDAHDVLLAEGLPCESYLDTGNRAAFATAPAANRVAAPQWPPAAAPRHRRMAALGARPHG